MWWQDGVRRRSRRTWAIRFILGWSHKWVWMAGGWRNARGGRGVCVIVFSGLLDGGEGVEARERRDGVGWAGLWGGKMRVGSRRGVSCCFGEFFVEFVFLGCMGCERRGTRREECAPMAGWSRMSCTEGSLPWVDVKSRSQDFISART